MKGRIKGSFALEISKPRLEGNFSFADGKKAIINKNGSTTSVALDFSTIVSGSKSANDYFYEIKRGDKENPNITIEENLSANRVVVKVGRDATSDDSGFYTVTATTKDANSHFGSFNQEVQITITDRKKLVASLKNFNFDNIRLQTGTTHQVQISVIGSSGETSPTDYDWTVTQLPFRNQNQFVTVDANGLVTLSAQATVESNGDYELVAKTKDTSEYQGSITNIFNLRMINI